MKQKLAKVLAVVLVLSMCAVFFAACVPSDATKAEANLKGNGYSTALITNDTALNLVEIGLKAFDLTVDLTAQVTGTNGNDSVAIYYCAEASQAKAIKDYFKAQAKSSYEKAEQKYKDGDMSENDWKAYKENYKNTKIGSFGKVAWTGTAAGVKAAG